MAIKRITTNLIKDSDIATVDIANNAITAAKITDGNITTAKLADLNVTAGKLAATLDLTGKTITVATATTGDSDTSPASTAFVQQEIAALVDSSPSSLNTLNELAAALGDDASFSTTVTNSIATKLPLAGGTMSGPITMSQSGALHNQFTSTGSSSKISIISADGEQAYINYSGATNEMSAGYDRTSSSFRFTNNDTLSSAIRMQINSTGNVGIGTINPQGTFVVSNSGAGGFEFTPDTTSLGVANTNYIASYDRSASAYRDIVIDLGGAESQAVRFKAGGNVGIGTSSPVAKLDIRMSDSNGVYGRGRDGNLNLENTNTSVTEGGWLSISGYMGNTASGGQYPMAYISGGKQTTAADGDYGGYLTLWTTSSGANGEANSGGYERMRIDSSGKVGIGTTSPSYPFHVTGSGDTVAAVTAGASSIAALNLGNSTNKADGGIRYDNSADALIFRASNAEKMRIDSSGKVGIGTTSPAEMLHIVGGGSGPELRLQNSSGSHYIRAYNDNWNFLANASVTAMTIKNSGQVNFGAGLGIGGTGAANTLDDYEEGDHTATITCASGSISLYSTYNNIAYTKVGRKVHVQGKLAVQSVSSPSGATTISLPFVVADLNDVGEAGTHVGIGYFNGSAINTGFHTVFMEISAGVSYVRPYVMKPSSTAGNAPGTHNLGDNYMAQGSDIYLNFTYYTNS